MLLYCNASDKQQQTKVGDMTRQMMTKHCVECHKPFLTVRVDAKFDCQSCRHKHWRKQKAAEKKHKQYLIEKQYDPAYNRIVEMCPELKPHFTNFKQRFDIESFYVMISVIDYMIEKGCVTQ